MNELLADISLIEKKFYSCSSDEKISILVEILRKVAIDQNIAEKKLVIPTDCEKYGFSTGYHNLGQVLHFLADMMEE